MIGVDFAGLLKFRKKKGEDRKAYLVLYACSLTGGIYLELLSSLETSEFLRTLKRFIARRSRPEKKFSDNSPTFVAAAKWPKAVMVDEKVHDFLSRKGIRRQFSLSTLFVKKCHFRIKGLVDLQMD